MTYCCNDFMDDAIRCLADVEAIDSGKLKHAAPGALADVAIEAITVIAQHARAAEESHAREHNEIEGLRAALANSEHGFKNFHRALCERFDYVHDEKDWKRDQVSLIEWIAMHYSSPRA